MSDHPTDEEARGLGKALTGAWDRLSQKQPVTDIYSHLTEATPKEDAVPSVRWLAALTDRERAEIQLCRYYAHTLAHGTAGHNQMMLIAKLADLLDERP